MKYTYSAKREDIIVDFWADGDKFEKRDEGIEEAVKKAVGDLTERTLKKKAKVEDYPENEEAKASRLKDVGFVELIKEYFEKDPPEKKEDFDDWHHKACRKVHDALAKYYQNWAYGKDQKIVNMTLKYVYCLGWAKDYRAHFQYCHIPLDSFTLEWIQRNVFPIVEDEIRVINRARGKTPIKGKVDSWSNLKCGKRQKMDDNYCYHDFVAWVREYFERKKHVYKGLYPIEAEFYIWKEIQLHIALENLCGQFPNNITKDSTLLEKYRIVHEWIGKKIGEITDAKDIK